MLHTKDDSDDKYLHLAFKFYDIILVHDKKKTTKVDKKIF